MIYTSHVGPTHHTLVPHITRRSHTSHVGPTHHTSVPHITRQSHISPGVSVYNTSNLVAYKILTWHVHCTLEISHYFCWYYEDLFYTCLLLVSNRVQYMYICTSSNDFTLKSGGLSMLSGMQIIGAVGPLHFYTLFQVNLFFLTFHSMVTLMLLLY